LGTWLFDRSALALGLLGLTMLSLAALWLLGRSRHRELQEAVSVAALTPVMLSPALAEPELASAGTEQEQELSELEPALMPEQVAGGQGALAAMQAEREGQPTLAAVQLDDGAVIPVDQHGAAAGDAGNGAAALPALEAPAESLEAALP